MRVRWTGLMALALAASSAVGSQQETAGADQRRGNPSLTALAGGVRTEAERRELRPRRFDLKLDARGVVVAGEVTVSFASPEPVEGDFRLALPADAVVTGYALDISGQLVDGVLVDRPQAKAVYEARVRQRIDPGLAEVLPDGTFQTRVFPVGPQGRTIRVRFVAPTGPRGLRLPLQLARPTEGWSIVVDADGFRSVPRLMLPGRGAVAMRATAGGFTATARGGAEPLDGDLLLVPGLVADALASRHATGERYLQLSGVLPSVRATRPERLRVYWDRSRSRIGDRLEAEIGVVRRVLERWRPAAIEIVAFNSSVPQRFTVATPAAAVARLRSVRYRGGTSFAGLDASGPADRCLLFSDGALTVDRAVAFRPGCPLDVVTSSPAGDAAWLRHLAQTNGGRLHTLLGIEEATVAGAVAAMTPAVTGVADADGKPLPFVTQPAAAGRWTVLARAPDAGATIVSTTGGGRVQRMTPAAAPAFDGEGALLARDRLATLGATERRADFVAVSRRYAVASPSLSFIVLETAADYVQADIAPPASFPDAMRPDYLRLLKDAAAAREGERRGRMAAVVVLWRDQVAWWERRFDPPTAAQLREERGANARLEQGTAAAAAGGDIVVTSQRRQRSRNEPPPPPPPPPPPMSAPPPPAPAVEEAGAVGGTGRAGARASVQIDAWQPDRPYLKALDAAPDRFDAVYEEQERLHGTLPAFYLDVAEWLRRRGRLAEATETVLAALETGSANEVTLGIVAGRLERYGAIDRAVELRARHAALDPTRPQPRRLLALALARRAAAQPTGARADLERAVALLYAIATEPLDGRWTGIDAIALMEMNAMLPRLRALGGRPDLDPRLVKLLDADIRIVVDWTTDATDLDLWVDEPSGERVIYSYKRSRSGGTLSDDMTQGYGPEEYWIRRAATGEFAVSANVFASDRLDPNGASLIQARIIRDWGRATEREEAVDIELTGADRGQRAIGRVLVR